MYSGPDNDVVELKRFAGRLDQFAATLTPREQALLFGLLSRVADPLERMRLLDDADFDADQLQLLRELD